MHTHVKKQMAIQETVKAIYDMIKCHMNIMTNKFYTFIKRKDQRRHHGKTWNCFACSLDYKWVGVE